MPVFTTDFSQAGQRARRDGTVSSRARAPVPGSKRLVEQGPASARPGDADELL
ncbi:hypothetical protein [Streptomyces mutabilis]|uniref:hypothetical protein n=1 Tax=Streptomyces mutabilis TaxID=67332 RepID=UPI00369D6B80